MGMDNKKDEIEKIKKLYEQLEIGIRSKEREIEKLERDYTVRHYLSLVSQKESLEEQLSLMGKRLLELEQDSCIHSYLYLIKYPKNSREVLPTFKCVFCGKTIKGFSSNKQKCLNEKYLVEDQDCYYGDNEEFYVVKNMYNEFLSLGLSKESILSELQEEIKNNYNSKKPKTLINEMKDN